MSTSVHTRTTAGEEKVRILPPEHRATRPTGGRPVAWIVAFVVAVVALAAVVVVEEMRIADRDDTIAALEQDVVTMQTRIEGQQAVIRDLNIQLQAATEQGAAMGSRVQRLRADLVVADRAVARLEARSEQLSATLANWVPPVTDGSYGGYLAGVNAAADPPRIVFEAVESESAGWMLVPVSPTADVTVWSYPVAATTQQTVELAYLDRMFSSDTPWAAFHRTAWYRIVVDDGRVTQIHQARPAT